MLNHVIIMGRLTKDPELRRTANGIAVVSVGLACDRDFCPEGGERETDFIDVVAWRSTAEFIARYFGKGRLIVVDGRIQTRRWTDEAGAKRRAFEILADRVYFTGERARSGQDAANGGQDVSQVNRMLENRTQGQETVSQTQIDFPF